jgi:hypothetical protein
VRLLTLTCAALVGCGNSPPPNDATLVTEFQAHRPDYERLLGMFREDSGVGRIAYDFTRPANFFSGAPLRSASILPAERLNQYHRLFDRLTLPGGIEGYDAKHVVYFWRYAEGMGAGLGGSSNGFAYSDSLPPNTPSAVGCQAPQSECWQFRPIADGWFVLEERHN